MSPGVRIFGSPYVKHEKNPYVVKPLLCLNTSEDCTGNTIMNNGAYV